MGAAHTTRWLLAAAAVAGAGLFAALPTWAQSAPATVRANATFATDRASAPRLSAADRDILNRALAAMSAGQWETARSLQTSASDPLVGRIIQWRLAASQDAPIRFSDINQALTDLQGWPGRETMRRRGEQSIAGSGLPAAAQVAWLTQEAGPLSGDGQIALAQAYARMGRRSDANAIAREAWRTRTLTPSAEATALAAFSDVLTANDHADRVDALLWRDDRGAAQRILPRLNAADRALANARIALQIRRKKGLQAAVDAVPASRRDHPGFLHDRARYMRRDGRPEDALPVIARVNPLDAPADARDDLYDERRLYVPRALRNRDYLLAYGLVSNHGLTGGDQLTDAEWLSGWIALRFLKDPQKALAHFQRLDGHVRAPISRARAAYWRAEALAALGQSQQAQSALEQAAALPFTYYGQLAATKIGGQAAMLALPDAPPPSAAQKAAFESRELVRVMRVMADIGDRDDFEAISFYVDDQWSDPIDLELLAAMAREYGYQRTAVRNAKAALRRGIVAENAAYPVMTLPSDATGPGRPEPALIHAITRQESEFDARAMSPVGARGMMQLMPATANLTARRLGVPYDRNALLSDPGYNVILGSAYLGDMVDNWGGSYVLAAVSYNAGPSRARQWIEDWGDPRSGAVDAVDWVELIPFQETRNYVMRVMENLQVYRYRLNGAPTQIRIDQDLKRGG
jgi:soluble lytic murein transglycosylase